MKKAIISVVTVLAVLLTFTLGFAQTLRPPAGVSGHVGQKLQAPFPPSVRLENTFGPLEHEVVVMPWGSSLSRMAKTLGRKNQKQINEFVNEVEVLNKGNVCFKSRDFIWEGCKVKIPSYKSREVQIRFVAANVVNDALANDANRARTELTQTRTSSQIGFGVLALVIVVLVVLLVIETSKTDQKKLKSEKEKNKKLEENKALADEEIKRLGTESDGLVEKVNKLYTEKDRVEAELRESIFVEYAACAVGAPYSFESRDNGVIHNAYKVKKSHIGPNGHPVVDLVECTFEGCGAEVVAENTNCNSHYWKQHGSSREEKPNSSYE